MGASEKSGAAYHSGVRSMQFSMHEKGDLALTHIDGHPVTPKLVQVAFDVHRKQVRVTCQIGEVLGTHTFPMKNTVWDPVGFVLHM